MQQAELHSKLDEILESKVDVAEWNLEVERVLPQLKVTIKTDNKVLSQHHWVVDAGFTGAGVHSGQ